MSQVTSRCYLYCINFMLKLASVVYLYSATVPVFACTLDLESPIYCICFCASLHNYLKCKI